MQRSPLDVMQEIVEKLLPIYQSQLRVMESAKDNPHILDRAIIDHALDNFEECHLRLPGLVSKYEVLKKVALSPKYAKDLETLKKNLDKLQVMGEQIMFLMKNLREYAEDKVLTNSDLDIMEVIFEHLNEASGLDMDPKELVKNMLAIKQENSKANDLQKDHSQDLEDINQAAYFKIQKLIQDLIIKGVHPQQIQGALLVQYIHMMSLLVSSDPEDYFNQQVANAGRLMISLVKKLKVIADSLKDDGPTERMQEVAATVSILREFTKERMGRPLTQKDQKQHGGYLEKVFMEFLDDIDGVQVTFLASTFLYNWVRLSTLESDVSEEYFQKLERNWHIIFDRIYQDERAQAS